MACGQSLFFLDLGEIALTQAAQKSLKIC
jgi:hypothetical protein